MIFNFFNQLSNASDLPPIVTIGALVIIVSLTLFGSLILIKVRRIIKVLNNLNNRLDTIGQRLGWPSGETENIQPYKYKLGSHINNEVAAGGRRAVETNNTANIAQNNGSEGHRINPEFSTKIHELLKKSGKPTPYHELTKQLSRSNLSLRKKVTFVKAKGGEFALKVSVIINARKHVERVNVIDRLPFLAKLHERFGGEKPSKIDMKNRRLEWSFDRLEAGESRIVSYIIYSKVGVLGKFALPTATAVYEREGEVHESESNHAFFIAEQARKPVED